MDKVYWKSSAELNGDPSIEEGKQKEFVREIPVDEVFAEEFGKKSEESSPTPRRDFLKYMGFGIAAASIAACEAPVQKSIPYLVQPEEIIPGVPNYYASSYFDGQDYASILIKTREGRPIKIEGNPEGITGKGTNARVQASVLSLYDNNRHQYPLIEGKRSIWKTVDEKVSAELSAITAKGGNLRILSSTVISPSTNKIISDFLEANANAQHISYDAVSRYGMLKANETQFGKKALPTYHFEKANVILSLACDFLANWISPIEHAVQYAAGRKVGEDMKISRHIQIESIQSLTGANADTRLGVRPGETAQIALAIHNRIADMAGGTKAGNSKTSIDDKLGRIANDLWNNRGSALVVSGSNDPAEQMIVNGINQMLGAYGSTINWSRTCHLRKGDDEQMMALVDEMKAGNVDALLIYNCNPALTFPGGKFEEALAKVPLSISFSSVKDETTALCKYVCPDHHYLESWSDAMPYDGSLSLGQPAIRNLYETRQMQDSMLKWMGNADADYYTYLREFWNNELFPKQSGTLSFNAFWNKSLHDGTAKMQSESEPPVFTASLETVSGTLDTLKEGIDLIIYEKTGIAAGQHSNNPWLQELPDPITRICWDNYINMPPAYMKEEGIEDGDIITIEVNGISIEGPAHGQPGQARGTVSAALGYGRKLSGKVADGVGFNVYPLVGIRNKAVSYYATGVSISKTGRTGHILASTQDHGTLMGRSIVREVNLPEYKDDPNFEKPGAVNADYVLATHEGKKRPHELDLWATEENPGHPKPNHHWGMVIDLNSCIGCGACVVACNAENNIPVVGKEEINNSREMHWIRIDRYYSSAMTRKKAKAEGLGKRRMWEEMEEPEENPQVVFQPMMCQHCNHAPCETVCPVAATTHSEEGLNMMAYNRCVGTRYCANNCPYKVRRFNWFKYYENDAFDFNMNSEHGRMVLNPDVVVRSRGVMEKCTMCVQRIQYGKLEAKKQRRRPIDGEIQTACAQVCPTNAITFGDYNNEKSELAEKSTSRRNYAVLEEYNVQPNVFYQVKVRNIDQA